MRIIDPKREPGTPFRELDKSGDRMEAWTFESWRVEFESGDNTAALRALVLAYELGVYPPAWVLDWIGEAMTAYMDAEGRCDIEKQLGLAGRRGSQKPLLALNRRSERELMALDVWACKRVLGIPIDEGAYKVTRRAEERGMPNLPSAEWLAEECRRHWLPHFDRSPEDLLEIFSDQENIAQFVESFPEDCRPPMG